MKVTIKDSGGLNIVFCTEHDVTAIPDGSMSISYGCKEWIVTEFSNEFLDAIPNASRLEKSVSFDEIKIRIKELTKHGQNASLTETKLAYGHAVSLLEGLIKDE